MGAQGPDLLFHPFDSHLSCSDIWGHTTYFPFLYILYIWGHTTYFPFLVASLSAPCHANLLPSPGGAVNINSPCFPRISREFPRVRGGRTFRFILLIHICSALLKSS